MADKLLGREKHVNDNGKMFQSPSSSASNPILVDSTTSTEITVRPQITESGHGSSTTRMDLYFPRPTQRPLSIYKLLISAIVSVAALPFVLSQFKSTAPTDYVERTKQLMSTTPLVDGHNDMPHMIRKELENKIYDKSKFTLREGLLSHTDLLKLKKGGVGGQFWSVYIPCTEEDIIFDEPSVGPQTYVLLIHKKAEDWIQNQVRDTLEQIDVSKRIFEEYDEVSCSIRRFVCLYLRCLLVCFLHKLIVCCTCFYSWTSTFDVGCRRTPSSGWILGHHQTVFRARCPLYNSHT